MESTTSSLTSSSILLVSWLRCCDLFLMAFVRWSGVRPLMDVLRRHCEAGKPLRILTTTYTNSTEQRALDELKRLGAEIKVSYDLSSTRLHAKAWIFHRDSGYSTAYIG